MIKHAKTIIDTPQVDGDIDAVVVRIGNTGFASVASSDRYRHVVHHGLGRVPVGCQIIMSSGACQVYTVIKDAQKIVVKFDTAEVDVNLRIW